MIRVEFVDGTTEEVEQDEGKNYEYDKQLEVFKVARNGFWIMYPREFVKSIRVLGEYA